MPETTFLNEAGVVITSTRIATPSHRFALRDIKNIRLVEPSPFTLPFISKKQPYRLEVRDFKTHVIAFETFDGELADKIKKALTAAKNAHVPNQAMIRKA